MSASKALARTHDHLAQNRTLILGHTLAAVAGGMVPLPYVSEWVPVMVKRDLVRRIAESRGVDLDEPAVRVIAEGEVPPPSWRTVIGAAPVLALVRRLRSAFLVWNVYRQAESATRTFAMGTLFDHYCARLHVGGELDLGQARALRRRLEATVKSPAGGFAVHSLRRVFAGALGAAARAPGQIVASLRRRRRLEAAGEVEAEEVGEEALVQTQDRRTALGRAAGAFERGISGLGRGFIDGLVEAFERESKGEPKA
jgi:hypothetical protein